MTISYYSFYRLLIGLSLTLSCADKETTTTKESKVAEINYGTSFGECIGYCKKEIKISPDSIKYIQSGWVDTVETMECSRLIIDADWDTLTSELDVSAFFDLSETIGCPDCADGGAEWIEIELISGEKHQVTFEYQNEPEAIKQYINELRDLFDKVETCIINN